MRNPTGKSVFHSEFDNFDEIVNELYGPCSVHTAHGTMLQVVERYEERSVASVSMQTENQSKVSQETCK